MSTIAHADREDEHGSALPSDIADYSAEPRRQALSGALAGGAAALIAGAVMLWAARLWGGVVLAQLISDRMTGVIPVSLFGRALGALEANAKPLALIGFTTLQVVAGALIGACYAVAATRRSWSRVGGATMLAALVWLLLSLVAAPLGGVGVFAANAPEGAWPTQGIFLLAASLFGLLTALFGPLAAPATQRASDRSRRRMTTAAIVVPALVAAWYTGDFVRALRRKGSIVPRSTTASSGAAGVPAGSTPLPEGFAFAGMPSEVTPTEEFYVVSKNLIDPRVDANDWSLEISGLVRQPLNLSYSDLLAREAVEFTSTLECISNPVGGEYISTAVWKGVPLRSLLEEAGLEPGVVDIELRAADGYVESFPLAEALSPDTVLVHTMNDAPLTDEHGFPARLIVPGIFGMKNVKWLEKIIPVDSDIVGFWQERGWSDAAPVLTMSRIDTPKDRAKLATGQPFRAGGVAFSGDRGVSRVEVSFDNGETWSEAELSEPLSNLSWRLWGIDHTPTNPGKLRMKARATDGVGVLQTEEEQEPLPDGATGYHGKQVTVG